MSNENQLTESQLFTIEALNKIQGFVWPKNANYAFVNNGNRFVSFTSGTHPVVVAGADDFFLSYGIYVGDISIGCSHPDWLGSSISKAQFDSVAGWVRNLLGMRPTEAADLVECAFDNNEVRAGDAFRFDWDESIGKNNILKWRHQKIRRETGWYRVWVYSRDIPRVCLWDSKRESWIVGDTCFYDDEMLEIDPNMVMTRDGKIVYVQRRCNVVNSAVREAK